MDYSDEIKSITPGFSRRDKTYHTRGFSPNDFDTEEIKW